MEGSSRNNPITSMAPFVLKTYDMVNDPFTELWIVWGKNNNSFIVMDPIEFSQRILPVYFKHNNFSSFVRQLNTYGFRKVDTDRWEFANEFFLRGQKHLLTNVVRKKAPSNKNSSTYLYMVQAEEEQELLLMEVGMLKREQQVLNEEVGAIDKRLRTTERRPEQMLAFLCKVVNDPQIIIRMVQEKEAKNVIIREKKRRFVLSDSSSSSSTLGDYDHESDNYQSIARTESTKVEDDGSYSNQEDEGIIRSYSTVESSQEEYQQQIQPFFYSSETEEASTIPYPFSLLECGF